MKKYKGKSLSDTISSVGSMLLFLLFAGCMLIIIAAAAGSYSRISSNFNTTFGISASLRYLSNKIKSSDSVTLVDNGMILQSGGFCSVIYLSDGALYETMTMYEENITPALEGGEKLFELSSLDITENDGLYRITAVYGGKEETALVGKG